MPAALPVVDTSTPLCCAPLGAAGFDPETDAPAIAARLRALADANRVRLIQHLSCCEGHTVTTASAAELLGLTEATASHHLKQLTAAGMLTRTRDGVHVHYQLDFSAVRAIGVALNAQCADNCC